jgi:hypothetical protein
MAFEPKMDNKIRPIKVYTTTNMNNVRNEEDYTIKEEVENNPRWGKNLLV